MTCAFFGIIPIRYPEIRLIQDTLLGLTSLKSNPFLINIG